MLVTISSFLGGDEKIFLLGTAVSIASIFEEAPDNVDVTIRNYSGIIAVNNVAMTKEDNCYYSYVYQSAITDFEGDYVVTIKATKGSNVEYKEGTFALHKQFYQ